MLYKYLFRRAIALHLTGNFNSIRSISAMATPPQSFTLDRNIFNQTLYSRMRDFWFQDVPEGATIADFNTAKRWFGVGQTQEQKDAFDNQCSSIFGPAIEALGPENLDLPTFESYEKDVENAETLSKPLLQEVKDAHAQDEKAGSDTLLSLILLLDQIPRNIYRVPPHIRLVFGHYDRLAWTLLNSSLKLSPNIIAPEAYKLRPVIRMWYLMPLMHSEYLPSHELFIEIMKRCQQNLREAGNDEAVKDIENTLDFEGKHIEPLKLFGRYPHRNEALGRENSKEEVEFLKEAETFGVQQDEKKEREKSEL